MMLHSVCVCVGVLFIKLQCSTVLNFISFFSWRNQNFIVIYCVLAEMGLFKFMAVGDTDPPAESFKSHRTGND